MGPATTYGIAISILHSGKTCKEAVDNTLCFGRLASSCRAEQPDGVAALAHNCRQQTCRIAHLPVKPSKRGDLRASRSP